jgi:hypothetical protein
VDVTHEVPGPGSQLVPAVDFVSTVDTPYVWELNMWYDTLNVGFRTRISGETDFHCIYGERVGLGRSYVRLDGKLNYDAWCEGIRQGRNYVGDGRSHLLGFELNGVKMGENGSELRLPVPGPVKATARVAAYLPEKPNADLQNRPYSEKPYWDIEQPFRESTKPNSNLAPQLVKSPIVERIRVDSSEFPLIFPGMSCTGRTLPPDHRLSGTPRDARWDG